MNHLIKEKEKNMPNIIYTYKPFYCVDFKILCQK